MAKLLSGSTVGGKIIATEEDLRIKQNKLIPGVGIEIDNSNKINIHSLNGLSVERCRTDGYSSATTWESVNTTRDLEDWIGDFDKRTRELRDGNSGIVNDLTTGGTTKALSAEQGKILQNNKVDKEWGKVLSDNNYTNSDKQKLSRIEDGAEKNKVLSVNGKTGRVTISKYDLGIEEGMSEHSVNSLIKTYISEHFKVLTQSAYDMLSEGQKNAEDMFYFIRG